VSFRDFVKTSMIDGEQSAGKVIGLERAGFADRPVRKRGTDE
jgi:hypothetical protein